MTSNISSLDSENEPHQHLQFLGTLPSDIVVEIFSYLEQQDCLNCMAVCRDWYTTTPDYSRGLWKDLMISTRLAKCHHRRDLCLGSHVKSAVIKPDRESSGVGQVSEQELHSLIQKLLDWGCTDIETIELIRCVTTHLDDCLDALKILAPRLTSLVLESHVSDVDAMHILYAFPKLIRFCYNDYGLPSDDRTLVTRPFDIPTDYCSKITDLQLNVALTKVQKESILKRCPALLSFIDTGRRSRDLQLVTISLDELFTWCPKISFLETTWITINESPDLYTRGEGRLRFFNTSDDFGIDQIGRQLKKNQDTLEHLSLRQHILGADWSRVLRSLHLPNLQKLATLRNRFDSDTLIALFNHCPLLMDFHVHVSPVLAFGSAAIQSIQHMHRLKILRLGGIDFDEDASLLTLLTRFPVLEVLMLYQITLSLLIPAYFESPGQLKSLTLSNITCQFNDILDQDKKPAVANLLRHLTCNSKIDFLQMQRAPIGHEPLLTIATIPTLEVVQVDLCHILLEEEILEFVRMLQKTAIVSLTLDDVYVLPFAVFHALAKLPRLKSFSTGSIGFHNTITHINQKGLQHMLWNSPKLATVLFHNEIVVEDGENTLTRDQVSACLNLQFDESDVKFLRQWEMRDGFRSDRALRNIAIRRINL